MPGLNLVCLDAAVAVTVGDDATGVATAGDRSRRRALNEECIEAFDVLTGNGIRRAGDRPPITAVFRTTA